MGYTAIKKGLKDHPNFKFPTPQLKDTCISYTLRCATALLSPKQVAGESHEVECVAAVKEILEMESEITRRWASHVRHVQKVIGSKHHVS